MGKRIISLLLSASIALGICAMPVYAAETTEPELTPTLLSETTAESTETVETTTLTEATEPTPAAEPEETGETTAATDAAETTAATETTEAPTEPTEITEPEPTEATVPPTEPEPTEPATAPPEPTEPLPPEEAMTSQSGSMSFGTEVEPEEREMPLYFQTDYPYVPYSGGSLATSGCTMTAIAMVATYLTGNEVLPDDLAWRFNRDEASNIQRMESVSTVLDLTYVKTTKWADVVEALEEGKVAIALLGKSSPFTSTQHTIVLKGITEDGRILVNDPYEPNYKKYKMIDGFQNGFPQDMITQGFGGAWIYDEYIPPEEHPSRYQGVELTQEERDLIAGTIWLEARGESFEGQQAIAEIILNRKVSGEFSDDISWIIKAEGQFRTARFLDDAKPGELQYKALDKALSGPNVLPMDVYFFGRQAANKNVWGRIGGHTFCYGE